MAQEDPGADVGSLTHEDVVGLINAAHLSDNQDDKQHLLAQVFEFAFNNNQRQHLSEFFPHLLEFELDRSVAVRKFIAGCIESVCKTLPEYIPQCIDNIGRLISDTNGNVAKRAILCATNIWRSGLDFLCTGEGQKATPQQITAWEGMTNVKNRIINSLTESDNDTLKPHALKFIETLVVTFSHQDPGDKKNKMDTFSLDSIPSGHTLLAPGILKQEGDSYTTLLIDLMRKPGQTATTITTLVNTLAAIARFRHSFIPKIVPALILLRQHPSPSFSSFISSQQQNVNHSLRLSLFAILRLRHPSLNQWVNALVDNLSALGAKDAEAEAIKLYGDLSRLPPPPTLPTPAPTPTPNSPPVTVNKDKDNYSNNINNNVNNNTLNTNSNNMNNTTNSISNKRKDPPDTPPSDPRLKNQKLEPPSQLDIKPNLPPPASPPSQPNLLSDTEQRTILSLLVSLPTELVVKLVFESMPAVPAPPPNAPIPANFTELLRSLQTPPQLSINPSFPTPNPILASILAPVAPIPTPIQVTPPVDPRIRDPRLARAASEIKNPSAAPPSPPNAPPSTLAPQSIPTSTLPAQSHAQPGIPSNPEPSKSPLPSAPSAAITSQPTTVSIQQPVQPLPPVKPQLPKAPVLPLPTFTDAQLRSFSDSTFARLMSSEAGATKGGKRNLWVALVARLAATLPLDGEMAQKLVTYVIADFSARRELVHTWVYHEFVSSPDKRYPQLVDALLAALRTLDPPNRAFNALIVEMPLLPEEVWTMMCEYSTSRDRVTLGLSTLRDLVVWRPPLRDRGLALLLEYTHHEDEPIRSPAIRLVANQLYPLPALTQAIVDHAIAMLRTLSPARSEHDIDMDADADQDAEMRDGKIKVEPTEDILEAKENGEKKEEDKKMEDGDKRREPQEMFTEGQIQRKLFLYFALCTKKHDLLAGLLDVYMTTTPGVRKVIHQQMSVLVNTIGMNSVALLQLIADCPKGGEGFVLQVLRILTETSRPLPGLVNAVKVAHKRLGDARLLIPVLGGMEKDEVIALLPRLLVLPAAAVKTVVTRLAVGHSPLACTELLVALHLVENVPIKRMLEATQYCLEIDTVFKQDVMAVVLSQLSSQPSVPQLFMFTALQTLQRLHKLTGYIIELMINMIPKQVWADKRLWDGFIRCCKVAKPTSYKVLLKLPAGPLEEYLKAAPEFKEPLAKAAKADKKSIPKAVLKVLGFDDTTTEEQA